jgi:hypothetical protein
VDLHDIFARGERAKVLLADPTYTAVTRALLEQYRESIFATAPGNTAGRDIVYHQYKALEAIASELKDWVAAGQRAQEALEDQAAENTPYDPQDFYVEAD